MDSQELVNPPSPQEWLTLARQDGRVRVCRPLGGWASSDGELTATERIAMEICRDKEFNITAKYLASQMGVDRPTGCKYIRILVRQGWIRKVVQEGENGHTPRVYEWHEPSQ